MFWYRPFSPTCSSTSSKSIELIFPAIPRLCRISTVWSRQCERSPRRRRRRRRRSCTMRRWCGTPSNYTAWPPSLILEGSHAELQTHVSRPLRLRSRTEESSSSLVLSTFPRLHHPPPPPPPPPFSPRSLRLSSRLPVEPLSSSDVPPSLLNWAVSTAMGFPRFRRVLQCTSSGTLSSRSRTVSSRSLLLLNLMSWT